MLVVVRVVRGVAMLSMHIVDVVLMRDRGMATVLGVDMHVGVVRQMHLMYRIVAIGQLVDVVRTGCVDVAVMEVVDVVLMRHRGMAAPLIVDVCVVLDGCMSRARSARTRRGVVHAQDGSRGRGGRSAVRAWPSLAYP